MAANLDLLFTGMEIQETHFFRITRDADLELKEDEADDLMLALEEELRRRRFGEVVRLEVDRAMPPEMRRILEKGRGGRPGGLLRDRRHDRSHLPVADRRPGSPRSQARALHAGGAAATWSSRARRGRRTSSPRSPGRRHPGPPPVRELRRLDPAVHLPGRDRPGRPVDQDDAVPHQRRLAHREGPDLRPPRRGKQVAVLVEIKARFDEQANITWARQLEQAGAHVVYGLVGLKTHSKTALVVRREGEHAAPLRPHRHRQLQPRHGSPVHGPGPAVLPPRAGGGRARSLQRPDRPVAPARLPAPDRGPDEPAPLGAGDDRARGRTTPAPAARHASCSSSTRWWTRSASAPSTTASQAGVQMDLIIRGICSLWPGVEGVSTGHPRPLHRRQVPGALAHPGLRQQRTPRVVHRLGGPDGAQSRPARRGPGARSRTWRRRRGSRRSSTSCWPTTAAPGSSAPTASTAGPRN